MSIDLPSRLSTLAAVGLRATPDLARTGWEPHLDPVMAHGLTGLLVEAWRTGAVALGDDALDRIETRAHALATLAVRLEAELLRLAPVLDRVGGVVIKGPAIAHGAYPDPGWRPFTDLDLLVPAWAVPATIERLLSFGYDRPRPDPSRAFLVRVAKATALAHPSGLVVDLHRTLTPGNLGESIVVEDILRERIEVEAGAVTIPAPCWSAHLVAVSLHAAIGDGFDRALSLRDVAQVAAHDDVDPIRVIELAERWRVDEVVIAAMITAHRRLGVPVPAGFEPWLRAGLHSTTLLAPTTPAQRSARRRLDELRHGQLRRRASLLRSLVAPDPHFLRWTYGDQPLPELYRRRWRDLARKYQDSR